MHSKWYQRMWVCLECCSSQRAYVLSEEYEIHNHNLKGIEALMGYHVLAHQSNRNRADFLAECKELNLDHLMTHSLSNIWRVEGRLTLGAVFDMIARKQCRTYRDRFIAILPADTTEACLWISRKCLEQGNYTPLLLAPSLHREELAVPGARWLRGHEHMSVLTWRLGRIVKEADDLTIIRVGKIMPELEVVGDIITWAYFSFAAFSQLEAFSTLINWIIAASDTAERQFLATIPRIYHFRSWNHVEPVSNFQDLGSQLLR